VVAMVTLMKKRYLVTSSLMINRIAADADVEAGCHGDGGRKVNS